MRLFLSLLLVCILFAILLGCSRHRSVALTSAGSNEAVPLSYKATSLAGLSDYIRSTMKISAENTAAVEELRKRLHERRPELADWAQQAAASANETDVRRKLAEAYMEENLLPFALQMYQEIKAVMPDDAAAEVGVARIWDQWGDTQLARQHAEQAIALQPGSADALETLGRIHLHRNELQPAVAAFTAALKVGPRSARLLTNAGFALLKIGDLPRARRFLEEAVALEGDLVEAHNNLGIVLVRLGERDAALREFLAVNDPPAAFNNLGVVYLQQRQWSEAHDAFRRALALDPGYQRAIANLEEVKTHMPPPTVIDLPAWDQKERSPIADSAKAAAPAVRRPQAAEGNPLKNSRFVAAYNDALYRFRARRYHEAIDILQWLLGQNADDALASNWQYWIGECYFGLREYTQAYVAFKRVTLYANSTKKSDALIMMRRAALRKNQRTPAAKG